MSEHPVLFPECVLPGCYTLVASTGDACDGCRTDFGDMLVIHPDAPRMTAEEIAERDRGIRDVYAFRATIAREHQ